MAKKTRKHIWPVALMSLAVFGVLAAIVALSVTGTGVAQAHPCDQDTLEAQATCDTEHDNAGLDSTDPNHSHDGTPPDGTPTDGENGDGESTVTGTIESSSTTGGAGVKLTLTIKSPGELVAGSSVELYLEDDYQVPSDIDPQRRLLRGDRHRPRVRG